MRSQQATHKDLVLCALDSVLRFEERESDKECSDDIQSEFGQQVRRISPVPNGLALPESPHLVYPRC
jgi:hypothetical protein